MIGAVDSFIRKLENWLAYFFTVAIVGTVSAQVFFRYVLAKPLSWSQEIATYLLIWIVMIGIVIAEREKANIAIQVLVQYLSKYGRLLKWIPWATMVLFFAVFGYGGAMISIVHSVDQSPITGLPLWTVYMAFPISALLGLWHLALDFSKLIGRKEKG